MLVWCVHCSTMLQNRERTSTVHGCLTHKWRRYVLYRLQNTDRPRALADLAEDIAVRESGDQSVETDREFAKEVGMKLHHIHVPKLADGGLVEYDRGDRTVGLVEYPEELLGERPLASE